MDVIHALFPKLFSPFSANDYMLRKRGFRKKKSLLLCIPYCKCNLSGCETLLPFTIQLTSFTNNTTPEPPQQKTHIGPQK